MQIDLDLSRHCIETAARLRVEQLIRLYFKHLEPDIEKQIESLTCFLETADFSDLRTRISHIEGQAPIGAAKVQTATIIMPDTSSTIEVRVKDQSVYFSRPLC